MNHTEQSDVGDNSRPASLAGLFTFCFGVILVLLPVHAFFSTWLGTTIGPLLVWKSWKEILLLALTPFVIIYLRRFPDVAKRLWSRRINQLIAAYSALTVILALMTHVPKAAMIAGLLMDLRFFAMFVGAQLIVESGSPWVARLKTWLPRWLLWTTLGLGVLALLQVTLIPRDFLTHFGYTKDATIAPFVVVDQNPNALRAFATMRGPNTLGAYLVLPLALAVCLVWARRWFSLSLSVLVLGTLTLFATGSRSAWLGMAVTMVTLGAMSMRREKLMRVLAWGALPVAVALLAGFWLATINPELRLAVFHSRADRPSLLTGSSQIHIQAVVDNVRDALAHPLGQGPGSAGPASFYNPSGPKISENYFVQVAEESGMLGLALFVTISVLLGRELWRRRDEPTARLLFASLIGLTVINFFLHGWADDPTAMTWWAIAGLYVFPTSSTPRADAIV